MKFKLCPEIKFYWNTVMPICLHITHGFFHSRKLSSCGTDHVAQKASNIWDPALYRKALTEPWIYFRQRPVRTESYCFLGFCFVLLRFTKVKKVVNGMSALLLRLCYVHESPEVLIKMQIQVQLWLEHRFCISNQLLGRDF